MLNVIYYIMDESYFKPWMVSDVVTININFNIL